MCHQILLLSSSQSHSDCTVQQAEGCPGIAIRKSSPGSGHMATQSLPGTRLLAPASDVTAPASLGLKLGDSGRGAGGLWQRCRKPCRDSTCVSTVFEMLAELVGQVSANFWPRRLLRNVCTGSFSGMHETLSGLEFLSGQCSSRS